MSVLTAHLSKWTISRRNRRFVSSSTNGLRVLFCGSDAFSIYSLHALKQLQHESPDIVKEVRVLCRSDKRVGRGLKQLHAVPIKKTAQDLNLELIQLDTFAGWTPPEPVDLIVTASFGLLVPSRILLQARYGGLNVHPSLLPDFRGAAPIQHAIIQRVDTTGVSVQTMHPTKFDHGIVLAQEMVDVGQSGQSGPQHTTTSLIDRLGPEGGKLLVDTLRRGLYLDPDRHAIDRPGSPTRLAPKIKASDRQINWQSWTADEIIARDRALDNLWDSSTIASCGHLTNDLKKRIVFHGPWNTLQHTNSTNELSGSVVLLKSDIPGTQEEVAFRTVDGALIRPQAATIEGDGKGKGLRSLHRLLKSNHVL